MAHMIDISNGRASCFTAGEKAWHGLGINVADCQTSSEAIRLANLNWLVEKQPCYLKNGKEVPSTFALVRDDTGNVLGSCGGTYQVYQNHKCFELMDALVGENLAMFETAGAIKDGKVVWMLAKLPKTVKLAANASDEVHTYILLVNDHTAKGSLRVIPTTVRVVCNNTLNLALGKATKGGGFTLRHCSTLEGRVEQIREKIGLIVERVDRFEAEVNALAARSLKETEVTDYLENLFPVKRKKPVTKQVEESRGVGREYIEELLASQAEESKGVGREVVEELLDKQSEKNAKVIREILDLYHNDETNNTAGASGTAWGLFNAVSGWADHHRPVRGKDDAKRTEARVSNNFFGPSNDIKQNAYQAALTMAGVN